MLKNVIIKMLNNMTRKEAHTMYKELTHKEILELDKIIKKELKKEEYK